jgi:CheY-like chemotaxis protein
LVLVVDDDEAIREALTESLSDEGFTVHAVNNGREAIDWLHSAGEVPQVVLLDLMMPVMDGRTFLRVREDDPRLLRVPVVVITAERAVADLGFKHSLRGILPKPIVLESLLEMIDPYSLEQTPPMAAS